jgi:hypothetical protein
MQEGTLMFSMNWGSGESDSDEGVRHGLGIYQVKLPVQWHDNQQGLLLATVLRASTDAVICTIPYRLTSR